MRRFVLEGGRFILGAVFVLSALLKAVDPYGVAYKVFDYLNLFFGYNAVELRTASLLIALCLCFVEFVLGSFLLMGIYRRLTARLTFLVLLFFTLMTAYTYFVSPIKECGCFGDAIKMSDGVTLLKNLFLLPFAFYLMRHARRARTLFTRMERWFFSFLAVVGVLIFMYSNIHYLPYADFRPYKVGNNIRELRDASEANYQQMLINSTFFVYEKDGVQQQFTADHLPDSTWTYIDFRQVELTDDNPLNFSFDLFDTDGDLLSHDILSDTTGVILLFSSSWQQADQEHIALLNELYSYAKKQGYRFYGVSPSRFEEIAEWRYQTGAEYEMLNMDITTIRTIVRSNPGILILKDGKIHDKLSATMLPSIKDIPNFVEARMASPRPLTLLQWRVLPLGLWALGYLMGILRLSIRWIDAILYLRRKQKRRRTTED